MASFPLAGCLARAATRRLTAASPQTFARASAGHPVHPPPLDPEFDTALHQLERAADLEATAAARAAQLAALEKDRVSILARTEALVVDLLEAKRHILQRKSTLARLLARLLVCVLPVVVVVCPGGARLKSIGYWMAYPGGRQWRTSWRSGG